jgi:ADP-ribose pyrophosphatase YjhB (NUDIX family)
LCLNDQHEVLVVREKNAVVNGYKLPGGLADPGEDLARTAVREVLEETGVVADFAGILAFREQHGVGFGVSDLYYVCRCIPSSTTIQACADEIEEAVWMPMDDYCNQTSHMNAIIARCAERGLQLEPERLPCDIESIKLDSVVHSKRQFQLYVPSAIAKHVDLADPWHGQEHESIGLLPNASL